VTLAEARARVAFPVAVPTALGSPDEVYTGDLPAGGQLTLVYFPTAALPEARETGVAVLLTQFRGESEPFIQKGLPQGARLTPTTVNGRTAYWIEGVPHVLFLRDPSGEIQQDRSRLAANTLLWEQGGITYRLESALSREAAVRIAESLR
jgi:hypothetical protein